MQQIQKRSFQRLRRKQTVSFWPVVIAIVLIATISVLFYLKMLNKNKQSLEKNNALTEQEEKDKTLEVPSISPKDTSKAIRNENFQLIDVREADEFVLKHIEASINIPLSELSEKTQLLSKTKTIILIDRKDSTKGKILTEHLKKEGLDVKYLEGGIVNYSHEGYNLVTIGNPMIQNDLLKVTSYSAEELIDQLLQGNKLKFIDTRPAIDFAIDHLNGSINIPLEDLEKKKDSLPLRTFVVFDKDPIRSFQAAVRLYDMDVIGVYNCKDTYETFKGVVENLGNENTTKEN